MPQSHSDREGETSSRPSMSADRERSERDPLAQSPVPLFDLHLRFLSDSYMSFFAERKKIEETYIDALLKLHKKARIMDTYLDGHAELSSARRAWREVVDHSERESQTRQAFVTSLSADILGPLSAFRETQDRTRKRIREDIKSAVQGYEDYADTLSKLKTRYLRRCADAEELRAGVTSPTGFPSSSANPLSPSDSRHSMSEKERGREERAAPVVTAPQPLRPLARRASGGGPVVRNRSPSSSTALQDLAHQGKRQLNQLMTFLDKRDTVKDGVSSGSRGDPLRGVRAKREADEADREYRKGVHWLETLRLRRLKLLEAGYMSLQNFIAESAERLKSALTIYTDTLTATHTTQTQLSTHLSDSVAGISPGADAALIGARIPRSLASAVPGPVHYYNYAVGECRDLIWGISLVDYATARGLRDGDVPKVVRICIREVDQRGLDAEGIYRVSGRLAGVQELQRRLEADEGAFRFAPTDDVFIVSSLLKWYLRDLPEPVFRFGLQDRIQHSEDFDDHRANGFALLKAKLRRLPPVHYAVLKAIVEHLARVAAHAGKNKMDVKNISIVFGGVIFGEDELPKNAGGAELLAMGSYQDTLMEDMIEHAALLFDERGTTGTAAGAGADAAHAPGTKLPPASAPPSAPSIISPPPAGPPALPVRPETSTSKAESQGGQQSTMIPPQPSVKFQDQALSSSSTEVAPRVSAEDFAPRLPAKPAMSIHPSARAGGGERSPTKSAFTDAERERRLSGMERERSRTTASSTTTSPLSPPTPSPRQRVIALPSVPSKDTAEALRVPPTLPPRPPSPSVSDSGASEGDKPVSVPAEAKMTTVALVGAAPGRLTPADTQTEVVETEVPFLPGPASARLIPQRSPGSVDTFTSALSTPVGEEPSAPVPAGGAPHAAKNGIPPPQPIPVPTPPGDMAYLPVPTAAAVPFPSVSLPGTPGKGDEQAK